MGKRIKVLITVKTYPQPSRSYEELVCTAGVLEDGRFIRLYPIPFRYKHYSERYKKYQWVEVEVEKKTDDPRPESYRPIGSIKLIGTQITPKNNWAERSKYVLAGEKYSMCELLSIKDQKKISLAIIRPSLVEDLVFEETDRKWKPHVEAYMNQLKLFGPNRKPLEKIPYKFSYKFLCEDSNCSGHKMMIEDWEVGELYRKMRDKFPSEQIACKKVRDKFFKQICAPDWDIHFFVGTVRRFGSWIILGTYWPKKQQMLDL